VKTVPQPNPKLPNLLGPSSKAELLATIDRVIPEPADVQKSTPFRAAIYIRVSRVPEGTHSYSGQDVQPDEAAAYVERHGGVVVATLTDLNETGRNSRRKNLRKLVGLVKSGQIDTLVIYSLDRLYRNVASFARFVGLLRRYHVRLVSLSENFDSSTPSGNLITYVLAAMGEFFVRQNSQRTRAAIKTRMQKGLPGGAYRFGYCNGRCSECSDPNGPGYCPLVGRPDRGDGRVLVPHPIEAHAVRLIAALYNQDMSDKDIADYLNSHTFEIQDDHFG